MGTWLKKSIIFMTGILVGSAAGALPLARVLVVLPDAKVLNTREGVKHKTGYFLSEITGPLMTLTSVGIEVIFATSHGIAPQVDPVSEDPKWFTSANEYQAARQFIAARKDLLAPRVLENLTPEELTQFDGVFVPGGHAALESFPHNAALDKVLHYFHTAGKPTALICHGPAALLSARNQDDTWVYAGYTMTTFSTAEEKIEEDTGALGGHVVLYLQDEMLRLGGKVSVAAPWMANALRDRELITAQNPQSDKLLTPLFLQALIEKVWHSKLESRSREVLAKTGGLSATSTTTLFLGARQTGFHGNFQERLGTHIALVKKLAGDILLSYKVYSNDDREIAVMSWKSQTAQENFFKTNASVIGADANQFLKNILFVNTDIKK